MTVQKLLIGIIYSLSLIILCWMPTYLGYYLSQANREVKFLKRELLATRAENSRLEIAYSNLSSPSSVAALTEKFLPEMKRMSESQFVSRDWFLQNNFVYNHSQNRLALDGEEQVNKQLKSLN